MNNINFDGMLILDFLTRKNISFRTIQRGLELYKITIFYLNRNVEFKCGYKVLPLPLPELAKSFAGIPKVEFPYKFITIENLFYVGPLPENATFEEDIHLKDGIFDFKEASIA